MVLASMQDPRSRRAKRRDDAQGGGRLAGAGTAGEDEDLAFDRGLDRPDLDLVIVHARGGLDPPLQVFRANGHGAPAAENFPEPPGRARLGVIEGGKVDRLPVEEDVAAADHLVQRVGEQGGVNLEQLRAGFAELLPAGIAVALVAQRVQRIHEAAAQPRVAVVTEAHLFGDGVGGAKADAPDVIGEAIGVFLYHPDAVAAVGLIDLGSVGGAHVMPLEKEHDVLDLLLFHPALLDALHPDPSDAGDIQQAVGRFLDDVERVGAEGPDDPPGELGPDALDQTAAEILFDPVHGGGERLLKALDGKLPAVPAVDPPAAPEGEHAAHMDLGHVPDDGDKVLVAPGAALENGVAVLFILIGNAFDHAAELFHDGSPAFPEGSDSFSFCTASPRRRRGEGRFVYDVRRVRNPSGDIGELQPADAAQRKAVCEQGEGKGEERGIEEGLDPRFTDHLDVRRLGDAQDLLSHQASDAQARQGSEHRGDDEVHCHIADAFGGGKAIDAHDREL